MSEYFITMSYDVDIPDSEFNEGENPLAEIENNPSYFIGEYMRESYCAFVEKED